MTGNFTFSMIKPTAVKNNHIGDIISIIIKNGYRIKALRMTLLSKEEASRFYEVHKQQPFYNRLVEYMSSGPIVAFVIEKENAVEAYRNLIGKTNPTEAADGTLRKLFGNSVTENAVHGSDSDENAAIEARFFFKDNEIF